MATKIEYEDPIEFDVDQNQIQILRWAAKRAGKSSVKDLTTAEIEETKELWRQGERPPRDDR